MSSQIDRPIIEQTFYNVAVVVGTGPTPLNQQLNLSSMIQAILLSNVTTNANSVFFGDQNVTTTTGIELVTGTSVLVSIQQTRQLYEVQDPTLLTAQATLCQKLPSVMVPVIVWNPSNFWLVAAAQTTIAAMLFRNVYI